MSLIDDEIPSSQPQVSGRHFGWLKQYQHFLFPIAGIAIALLAIYVLENLLRHTSRTETLAALHNISWTTLALAVFFTALSYAAVALYDVVAVDTIAPNQIPRRIAAVAGAAGYAISNALGFSLLTGGALRYRIYAAEGISLADIGKIVGTSWFAIWFALIIMVGAALLIDPQDVPFLSAIDIRIDIVAGILILGGIGWLIYWLSHGERNVSIGSFSLRLPNSKGALTQILRAWWMWALPRPRSMCCCRKGLCQASPSLRSFMSSPSCLALQATRQAASALLRQQSSQGLASVENPMQLRACWPIASFTRFFPRGCHRRNPHLGGHAPPPYARQAGPIRQAAGGAAGSGAFSQHHLSRWHHPAYLRRHARYALSCEVAVRHRAGISCGDVASGGKPRRRCSSHRRARPFQTAGARLGGRDGASSLRRGVFDRKRTGLGRGKHFVPFALSLWGFRDSFYRRPIAGPFELSWNWIATVGTTVLVSTWLGFFVYRHIEYSSDLWWDFAWNGNAPRFLRATVLVFAVVAAVGLHSIINRHGQRRRKVDHSIPDAVPALVARCPHTDAALAMLGDKQFLLAPDDSAFIMYAQSGGSLIALGEPIGDAEAGKELAWSFHSLADRLALRTVFYGVGPQSLPLFLDMGLIALKLGEVARVDLTDFSLEGPRRQPFRYADRKGGQGWADLRDYPCCGRAAADPAPARNFRRLARP